MRRLPSAAPRTLSSVPAAALPAWLRESAGGVLLALKVQPRASRNQILGPQGSELRLCVTAPPVDSAANEAVVAFLADALSCARHQVTLVRGAAARHKLVAIHGLAAAEIARRLHTG